MTRNYGVNKTFIRTFLQFDRDYSEVRYLLDLIDVKNNPEFKELCSKVC